MGKPVSLTALSLCLLLLRGTPRCSHPGSRGRGVAQPLTPQLLSEQTMLRRTSSQLSLWALHIKIYRGNISSTLDIPESVFTEQEFSNHHDEQTFSSFLHSETVQMSLGGALRGTLNPQGSKSKSKRDS